MGERRQRRQGRRRSGDTSAIQPASLVQITQPVNELPLYDLVSPEGIQLIHDDTSLELLADEGIDFYDGEALDVLRDNGVRLDGSAAYLTPEQIETFVGYAPSSFTQLARSPERSVTIGEQHICFAPVYGPPYVTDLDRGLCETMFSGSEAGEQLDAEQPGFTQVGRVTSSADSYTTGKMLALGYVDVSHKWPGARLIVECSGRPVAATATSTPFFDPEGIRLRSPGPRSVASTTPEQPTQPSRRRRRSGR